MDVVTLKDIFLRYILIPLLAVIFITVLTIMRKKLPAVKTKTLLLYILVGALCIAVLGFLGFSGNAFSPFFYIFSVLVSLIFGIFNINLLQFYFKTDDKSIAYSICFESLISVTIMLLGSYSFYLIFNWMSPYPGYALMACTSILVFIVPLSFYYCYLQFLSIPPSIYDTWQPNLNTKPIEFERLANTKLLILNFEINRNIEDGKRFRVQAKTPIAGVPFGDWFYRVVEDYNYKHPENTIELTGSKLHDPYSWIFYVKKSFFHLRRIIDFKNTVINNRISDNNIIICKRVIQHTEGTEHWQQVI